ncbi:Rieske (2Fe-2S) protein [Halobiforma nitratireducens]|uniref:Rieske iron-sulfur domain protein n=1 Tax=Halobiforma nitratireducens JCM 10879 TaxID=1227454 RepID=M0LQT0_9EURY|nr:Rieske (2Fe-2S) protein [Halobiforma nitratireducens]EMA35448.1 Rieske iron-sulfur domain protein [Halobiforma nitratireducens JCM 10879]
MGARMRLTSVETVREEGSWLFTVRDGNGDDEEVFLVPCDEGTGSENGDDITVEAWINRCTHESQRLDTGRGVAIRDGEIVCPRHGSMFDACSGDCDNGPAADTTLPGVDTEVEDGTVYLTDDERDFLRRGGLEDDEDEDDGPQSTSHISF